MKTFGFFAANIKLFLMTVIATTAFPAGLDAQSLTPRDVDESVAKIAEIIEENYVYPDKGKKIAEHLMNRHRSGSFKGARSWQDFGRLATGVLRSFSGDGHLFVEYDPQQVKELLSGKPDPTETEAENSFYYGAKAREKNYGFSEVKILDGNTGYLKLSEINISEKSLPVLIAAMQFLANSNALVIDLRDNSGGGSNIGAALESFFLPKNTALLEFRSRTGSAEITKTVTWLTEKKYDAPVFIIINKKTASAAEAFAFALQAKKRAVIVGQTSAGGANMSSWYAVNDFIYVSVSTAAPVLPGTETSWEGKGVEPDFVIDAGREIEAIKEKIGKK